MAASSDSNPEQTQPSTQGLPKIPTVTVMESWNEEDVLLWLQERHSYILRDNNLKNFTESYIVGIAFLTSDVEFYQGCGLPRGIGLALKSLADQVKDGKFI